MPSDTESRRVTMPPSNFGRAGVDRHGMALRRIADGPRAAVEHQLQHCARIVGRAADDEVVGGVAPDLLQPLEIRFESSGGQHDSLAARSTRGRPSIIADTERNAPSAMSMPTTSAS